MLVTTIQLGHLRNFSHLRGAPLENFKFFFTFFCLEQSKIVTRGIAPQASPTASNGSIALPDWTACQLTKSTWKHVVLHHKETVAYATHY